jgi:hypothetical protein
MKYCPSCVHGIHPSHELFTDDGSKHRVPKSAHLEILCEYVGHLLCREPLSLFAPDTFRLSKRSQLEGLNGMWAFCQLHGQEECRCGGGQQRLTAGSEKQGRGRGLALATGRQWEGCGDLERRYDLVDRDCVHDDRRCSILGTECVIK